MEFKVIFTGKITNPAQQEKQIGILAKSLSASPDKAQKVLNIGKPIVVRKVAEQSTAEQLVKLFASAGLEAVVKKDGAIKSASEAVSSVAPAKAEANDRQAREVKLLKLQLAEVSDELVELRDKFNALADFVDEHIAKKDAVLDFADSELDELLENDELLNSLDTNPDYEQEFAPEPAPTEPRTLSKYLPALIAFGVVSVILLSGWAYMSGAI